MLALAATVTTTGVGATAYAAPTRSAAVASQSPVLRAGSRGPAVTEVQRDLRITADGIFGKQTRAAVIAFQSAHGLVADGIVGPKTWAALRGTSPAPAASAGLPAGISAQAIAKARAGSPAVDINLTTKKLYVLKPGPAQGQVVVAISSPISAGGTIKGVKYQTPVGSFSIGREEGRDYRSHSVTDSEGNGAPMPFAAFFKDGKAIHQGSLGPSHGCVHVPSMANAIAINKLPPGTLVVVH
jgi:peptidoglycan hydrolase-like protein with peptidoglycan-binding domain